MFHVLIFDSQYVQTYVSWKSFNMLQLYIVYYNIRKPFGTTVLQNDTFQAAKVCEKEKKNRNEKKFSWTAKIAAKRFEYEHDICIAGTRCATMLKCSFFITFGIWASEFWNQWNFRLMSIFCLATRMHILMFVIENQTQKHRGNNIVIVFVMFVFSNTYYIYLFWFVLSQWIQMFVWFKMPSIHFFIIFLSSWESTRRSYVIRLTIL